MTDFQGYSSNGSGFAEFYDSDDGKDIEVGQSVVLVNGKVRVATLLDALATIIGVVRPKNSAIMPCMTGKNLTQEIYPYEVDEFGAIIEEKYQIWSWNDGNQQYNYPSDEIPPGVVAPQDKKVSESTRPKKNSAYNGQQTFARDTVGKVLVNTHGQTPVKKTARKPSTWLFIKSLGTNADLYFVSFNNKPLL
jgi:hypothetical protein